MHSTHSLSYVGGYWVLRQAYVDFSGDFLLAILTAVQFGPWLWAVAKKTKKTKKKNETRNDKHASHGEHHQQQQQQTKRKQNWAHKQQNTQQ